jgi:glycosyltransferase involved in cell wall biosynthesis
MDPREAWCYGTEAATTEAMHALEAEAICSASRVSCVSNSVAAEVTSLWPSVVPEVIPNFYCLDHKGARDELLGTGFGFVQCRFVILFAGRWEKTKGCDIVAEIARRMAQHRRYLFLHAGAITDPPISQFVRHVGHVDDPELVSLYQSSTLLLMPSRYEPFGLTAIEAMWHGTPVLAHRVGGLAQIVEEGANGWLMDTLDPSQWCERIRTLLERGANARPNRDELRALAVRRFTGDRSIGKYLRMFRELVDQSPDHHVPATN